MANNVNKPKVDEIKYVAVEDRKFCLGQSCPDKNCKICPAEKSVPVMDVTDNFRKAVKTGYYTSTIMSYKDPVTGEEKYCYTRP